MPLAALPPSVKVGTVAETVFARNPKRDSPYPLRATHLDGRRTGKAVLSSDPRIEPGRPCRVRITRVAKPQVTGRGHLEAEYAGPPFLQLRDDHYVDRVFALKLQAILECGLNVLLDGPQGSGKTVLSRAVATALGMEYVFFNCSACYEATDFLASLQLRATESGQVETVWVATDIRRALEAAAAAPDRRYLIFLDEFNRCREMARNGIMPALDATRRLYDPVSGGTLPIPDNVLWIAAINNGAQFTGTTSVDPAQLDRFAPVQVGYPPPEDEARLLRDRHPSLSRRTVDRVVALAHAVRTNESLGVDLSMRATEEVCMLLEHPNFVTFEGNALRELVRTSFCGRFPGHWDDPASDAGLVWKCLTEQKALEQT